MTAPRSVKRSVHQWVACCALLSGAAIAGPPATDPADAQVTEVRNRARAAAERMRVGDAKLQLGDVSGACKAYQETLDLLPSWWMPHLALVRCGRLLGHPPKALLEHARFAVKARPKIPATHLQLGLTFEELDRPDDAIAAYEAALRLRSDSFEARYRLGLLRADRGDLVAAIRHLNAVIAIYPDHVVALSRLAELHEKKGHVDAALATLEQLLGRSHHPRMVLSRIGRLLSRHGRTKEAAEVRARWQSRFGRKRPAPEPPAPESPLP